MNASGERSESASDWGLPSQLKLTSIERLHWLDHQVDFPNEISCALRFSGRIDRQLAAQAFEYCIYDEPLGHVLLEESAGGRLHWRVRPRSNVHVHWVELDADHVGVDARSSTSQPTIQQGVPPYCFPQQWWDLRQHPPVRLIVVAGRKSCQVIFQAHHAAFDGLAGLNCTKAWIRAYDALSKGELPSKSSRQPDPQRLLTRNHLGLMSGQYLRSAPLQPIALFGAAKFLMRKITPLVEETESSPTSPDGPPGDLDIRRGNAVRADKLTAQHGVQALHGPSYQTLELTADTTRSLQDYAQRHRLTVNDLLLAETFRTLYSFRKQHHSLNSNEWLRLAIPINVRSIDDRRMPAANRSSIVQLDRRERDFLDPSGLRWGVGYELSNIFKWRLEKTFLLVVRAMAAVPGMLESYIHRQKCRATALLTNLGRPYDKMRLPRDEGRLRVGNLHLESFDLRPPLRPMTYVGLATARYMGTTRITLHHARPAITSTQAAELLHQFSHNLQHLPSS